MKCKEAKALLAFLPTPSRAALLSWVHDKCAGCSAGINAGILFLIITRWNIYHLYVIPRPKVKTVKELNSFKAALSQEFPSLFSRRCCKSQHCWLIDFISVRINIFCLKEYRNVHLWGQALNMAIISVFAVCAVFCSERLWFSNRMKLCPMSLLSTGKLNQGRFCPYQGSARTSVSLQTGMLLSKK